MKKKKFERNLKLKNKYTMDLEKSISIEIQKLKITFS